jgi:hypothetical protein
MTSFEMMVVEGWCGGCQREGLQAYRDAQNRTRGSLVLEECVEPYVSK